MPAIGKTALAVNIAHSYKHKYPDAQLYIDCYGYTAGQEPLSDEKILGLLLLAFEIPASMIPDSFEERIVLWQSLLRERRSIIIFDNINSEKQINKIMPTGNSNTLVLITSRNQLLNIPDVYSIKLDTLDEDSSVKLLYEVSEKKGKEYEDLFRQVVRKCECLPLAIVIIGRRFKDRESKRFIYRFINSPNRMAKSISGVDVIYDSFDTSYVLLNNDEKNAFKVLGISPCMDMTPNSCAAMLNVEEDFAALILDSLYDKRLIIETGNDRYRLHDLMREFARDKYDIENGLEKREWIRRLILFYEKAIVISNNYLYPNTISLALDINISEKQEMDWMKWLGEERINLVACLDYLFSVNCEKEYIELAHLLSSYIRNCFLGDDVLKIAENAVEFSEKNNYDYYLAVSLMDLGLANENVGNFTDAIILFHRAENIWQNKFCDAELAYALSNEGFTLERLGKYDEALDILQNALELYKKNNDLYGIGFVKNAMGAVNWRMKKYSVAKKIFEETLGVRHSINDRLGMSSTKNNLGFTFLKLGDLENAFILFNESLNISIKFNDAHGQSVTLNNIGYYYIELEEFNQAIIYALRARETAEHVGNKYQIARSYDVAAKANIGLGNYLDAKNDLLEAMELFKELKVPEYKEVLAIFNSI